MAAGYRFEVVSCDPELAEDINANFSMKACHAPMLFDGELGVLLDANARNFNVSTEIFSFVLLPILGSQIHPVVRLMVNPGTNYQVPALRFCRLVGDSGVRKSPIIDTLMLPLKQAQQQLKPSNAFPTLLA